MVRVGLILFAVSLVVGAGVWFSRQFDPEVARLLQQRAKQRLEKANVTYLAVEASGREVTVTLPPGTQPSTIAAAKAVLSGLEGATAIAVRGFGEGGRDDERLRKMLPKERLTILDSKTKTPMGHASEFPTPAASQEIATRPRTPWNLSIGRPSGGHVEVFDLGAAQ